MATSYPRGAALSSQDSDALTVVDLLHDLRFTTTPNPNLICPICVSPFVNAESIECGHTFCARCLRQAQTSRRICPTCRSPCTRDPTPAYTVRSLVDELVAQCPNTDRGCSVTLARQFIVRHVASECDFRQVRCTKCGNDVMARELAGHTAECTAADACGDDHGDVAMIADQVAQLATTTTKHEQHLTTLDTRLSELEATTARLQFTQSSLETTVSDLTARVSAIEAQLAQMPPHPPPPPVDLEIAVERLAVDLDSLRAALTTVEMRASVEVQSESLRLREELQAVKGLAMGLKASVGFLLQRSSGPPVSGGSGSGRSSAAAGGARAASAGGKSLMPGDTKL